SVVDVGRAGGRPTGPGHDAQLGGRVGAADGRCQVGRGLARCWIGEPYPDAILVRWRCAVRPARLAAILHLDAEGDRSGPRAARGAVAADAREAGLVGGRLGRLGPWCAVSRIAQPADRHAVAAADKAIVVLRVEGPLLRLPVVGPASLHAGEIVE